MAHVTNRTFVQGNTKRMSAKQVLEAAIRHAGKDCIVIASPGRSDQPYLATSMPVNSSTDIMANIALLEQATKQMKRYLRNQLQVERAAVEQQAAPA